ncbi:MAG: ArsA family ATPase [Gemmatimonadetes bacterium]|jgi:anion-transporting  ArsA/GET3 family ATPase|nr:ArsA family ATPase [Gemmatimonadota bacterium]MBK7784617.1 ArsA family ATPase [Gemmatimonadota bacterium]MBK9066297.1 ArsA family ATPase [Gemmatimonadota bacterium]
MKLIQQLARRRLIVVTGKGGVGKTTLTAAIGRLLAAAGRKTLLLEIDPRESLHQLFGTEPSAGAIIKVSPKLGLQNLQPHAVIESLVREKVPLAPLANRIIGSQVFQQSVAGAPGLKEMAVLGYALRTVLGEYRHSADVVVLDAPATGHGVSMLTAPLHLAEVVAGGQLGEMSQQLARFIADPNACGVMIATLAEEMPVQETLELIALLKQRMGRPPEAVVVNGLYPEFPAGPPGRPAAESPSLSLWRERRAVNERELARIRQAWKGPRLELPLLPLTRGPALLDRVVQLMELPLP